MAVKSIFSVDIKGLGQFREFKQLHDKYQKALKSAPGAWALVSKNIDGSRASFQKLVDGMAAANVQEKLREKAQKRADRLTQTSAERWKGMARDTREFARNIAGATTQLLKWASVTGVISGLIGAGGLFGIDRLALGAGSALRSATGRGTSVGGQAAFGAGLGSILENPDSFLSAIAAAKYDVRQAPGLISAGLTPGQRAGDTTEAAIAVLRTLRKESQAWNPAMFANMLDATRQSGFASPEMLGTLRAMSPERFEKLIQQTQNRRTGFELPSGVAERWQDFTTQMNNAGKSIETTLIKGLVPLAPGLTKLSESVERIIAVFLEKGGPLEKWITQAGTALEKFAGYVGTDDFQRQVRAFIEGVGAMAAAAAKFVTWFGGGTSGGAHISDRLAWARHRREGLKTPGELRRERAEGKATALGQLGAIFGIGGQISSEQLLGMVRQREGSGDSAVSPKGAIGRYQIMPGTAQQYGRDPSQLTDPKYNEETARRILADLVKRYHGNVQEVLAAYNAGPDVANRFRAAGDDTRVLPRETQRYVGGAQGMTVVTIENNTGGNAIVSANGLKN